MWTAPAIGCVVLVLGVIPAVVGLCVSAGNDGLVSPSSMLLGSMDKVLPEVLLVGILLVDEDTAVSADPLRGWLLVLVLVALFGVMDVDTVHLDVLLLGESEVTASTKVKGGILNDPPAIIAVIAGTGVDVVFSPDLLQVYLWAF